MKFSLLLIGVVALVAYVQATTHANETVKAATFSNIKISDPTPGTTWEAGSSYTIRWHPLNDTGVNPDDGNKTKTNTTVSIDLDQSETVVAPLAQNISLSKGAAHIRIPDHLGQNFTLSLVGHNISSTVSGIEIHSNKTE